MSMLYFYKSNEKGYEEKSNFILRFQRVCICWEQITPVEWNKPRSRIRIS